MYTIKIKKESYYIPSGWYELTYGQWKDLQKTEESDKVLSILTGIPEKIVKKLDDKSLFNLNNLLSWINIKLNIDEYKAPESLVIKKGINKIELPLVQDIKEKTFGQKIYFQNLLKDNLDDIYYKMAKIVLVYSQPVIEKKKFDVKNFEELELYFDDIFLVNLYSTAMFYIEQIKAIIDLESKALSSEPTIEQKMAGIDRFNKYGAMNTVKGISKEFRMSWDEVMEEEYNITFTRMMMGKDESDFQKEYSHIMKRKNR